MNLQYITHFNDKYNYISGAEQFLKGGGKWVQLRMKEATTEEIISTGKTLRELCSKYDATLLLDDHVELVRVIGADGVHVGKNDMPPAEARKILGQDAIIGGTANTFENIKYLVAQGVNYIGLGPFRFTNTKQGLSSVLGLEGYKNIINKCNAAGINTPIIAIGGITPDDITEILNSGVNGIALSGTIINAQNPIEQTKIINKIINR